MKKEVVAFLSISVILYGTAFALKSGKTNKLGAEQVKSSPHAGVKKSANLALNKQMYFLEGTQGTSIAPTNDLQMWMLSQIDDSACAKVTAHARHDTRQAQIGLSCRSRGLVSNDTYNNIPLH